MNRNLCRLFRKAIASSILALGISFSICAENKLTTREGVGRLTLTPLADVIAVTETGDSLIYTPDMMGGVYFAYPGAEAVTATVTAPPKGYKPFYVSHYGRHGSRYLISDKDYENVRRMLVDAQEANVLTPLGQDVLVRLDSVMKETSRRGGDLTPLGVRQHRGIAERLYDRYPEVFKGEPEVSARSTTVIRCILSMDAFCERLKELNPSIRTTRESSDRYMDYLNHHTPESNAFTGGDWRIYYRKFENSRVKPDAFVRRLISDEKYIDRHVDPAALMWGLYWLAADSQNIETPVSFYDLFTPEEYFGLWEAGNYHNYVVDSSSPESGGLVVENARNLLNNIIDSADAAIASGKNSATLRFGHDGNLQPLAAILQLEGACPVEPDAEKVYQAYQNFRVTPMAGNVQIIFFRNKEGDVLVKFLLNEQEMRLPIEAVTGPYYRWEDVKRLYGDVL